MPGSSSRTLNLKEILHIINALHSMRGLHFMSKCRMSVLLHDVWEILPESTNLESKFGSKAKKGIWVLASKKNPSYLEEFEKKLAEN